MSESRIQDLGITELRTRCVLIRNLLTEIADIHLEIDTPDRVMGADEPDWIGRLRKICLHVSAIGCWEIGVDVEHVMAPDIRAGYQQISAVWNCMPPEVRLEGMDGDLWNDEARNGILATYDHPTPQSLGLPAGRGGFSVDENWLVYAQIISWLGDLALGYGLAVGHLSRILGRGLDIDSRITSVLQRMAETMALKDVNEIAEMFEKERAEQS